jgi:cytochrome c55X
MYRVSIGWAVAISGALAAGVVHAGEPAPERRAQLVEMVRQDCGSCHGLTLKGGLGPSLLPAALGDKDAVSLQYTILDGRRGTAMPPWRPFMREDEALWIVTTLKNGLPERERR